MKDSGAKNASALVTRRQTGLNALRTARERLRLLDVAGRAAADPSWSAASSVGSWSYRVLIAVVRSGSFPFVLPAWGTLALLTYVEPSTARVGFHLAERLMAVLACGCWLMAVLALRSSATKEPSSSADPLDFPASLDSPPTAAYSVDQSAGSATASDRAGVGSRAAEEASWLWRRGLLLVALWLTAALGHMVAHYLFDAAESGALVSLEGFFTGVGESLEQQLLVLQIAVLVLVLVCIAVDDAFRAEGYPPVRVHTVVLAFVAVLTSSLSELETPLTTAGWLIGIHVGAMTAWCGGAAAALALAWHTDDYVFLHGALSRFSELAAVTAVTVLVTGGALGLDWTSQHTLADLTGTLDGLALLAKSSLGVGLVFGFGYLQRYRSLPRLLAQKPSAATLCAVGALELTGMSVATAFGVVL